MPDINFDCPHCSQNLDAPEDMAGDTIPCPTCQKEIKIPRPTALPAPQPPPEPSPDDSKIQRSASFLPAFSDSSPAFAVARSKSRTTFATEPDTETLLPKPGTTPKPGAQPAAQPLPKPKAPSAPEQP